MAPILDQFEVESNIFYSGSYTDSIRIGSMFDTTGRILAASCGSGSNELKYAQLYSTFADYSGSNRHRSLGIGLRFRGFFSDELYQDTILPDVFEAFILNGGKPVLALTDTGLYPVLINDPDANVSGGPVGKLVFTTHGTTASYNVSTSVDDNIWLTSFPFQGRYRNVTRNIKGTFYRSNIQCPASESQVSFDGIAHYGLNGGYPSSSLATVEVVMPLLWTQTATPVSGNGNSEPLRYTLMDVTGSVNGERFFGLGTALFPLMATGVFDYTSGSKRPSETQISKLLFGFGDNYQGVPIINAITSSKLQNDIGLVNGYYVASIDIRGWKYGVVNGFPTYSSCIYRNNRYGQLRDMLEQRKLTKFFDARNLTSKKTSTAAIQIAFVSGSQSFVTASLPNTLNLHDSGIYDFEYKSGQPWQDPS